MHFILSCGDAEEANGYGSGGPQAGPRAALEAFAPILARLGPVTRAASSAEASALLRQLNPSLHLCFALPHQLPRPLAGPTIPVFGWGLSTMPNEAWGGVAEQDWRVPLAEAGRAIVFSPSAAASVAALMGPGFPVAVIAPPCEIPERAAPAPRTLRFESAALLDTATWPAGRLPVGQFSAEDDLAEAAAATPSEVVLFNAAPPPRPAPVPPLPVPPAPEPPPVRKTWRYRAGMTRQLALDWYREVLRDLLPRILATGLSNIGRLVMRLKYRNAGAPQESPAEPAAVAAEPPEPPEPPDESSPWDRQATALTLTGTVFAAVHGPWDRAWSDAISAFVWAFRDRPDATLVVLAQNLHPNIRAALDGYLQRLRPYTCRIVLLDTVLTEDGWRDWISATSFYVSASHAEAAPLPLLRFMAAGRPAVAPHHGALAELIDPSRAILVASTPEHDFWPHDPREKMRSQSQRLNWDSLRAGYVVGYALAQAPESYAVMSANAAAYASAFCGADAVWVKLAAFLATVEAAHRQDVAA